MLSHGQSIVQSIIFFFVSPAFAVVVWSSFLLTIPSGLCLGGEAGFLFEELEYFEIELNNGVDCEFAKRCGRETGMNVGRYYDKGLYDE